MSDEGQMSGGELLLPFDNVSRRFAHGFECGHVWTRMRYGDLGPHTMHQGNAEMVLRMAEACDLNVRCDIPEDDDTWMHVSFEQR